MFKRTMIPRFSETDAIGHINNGTYAIWFEEGRREIFLIFNPSLSISTWNLILRKLDIDFLSEGHLGHEVQLEVEIASIANTSFVVHQRAFQNDSLIATSKEVLVHYDYRAKTKSPIPVAIRKLLEEHLIS